MPQPPEVAFSPAEAHRHVVALATEIGPRPAGSGDEANAADYVSVQLASYGYSVRRQAFQTLFYTDLGSELAIIAPEQIALEVLAMGNSPSGRVEGPLVDAGLAREADLSGLDLLGSIALVERGDFFFSQKVANVARAGAVAMIMYNSSPDSFQAQLRGATIPAVALSGRDGHLLRELLQKGEVRVLLDVRSGKETRQSQNVIAESLHNASTGVIVVGAHIDSVSRSPGGNDNASGVGVMLEMARVLASRLPANVVFVGFGAEEVGLVGANSYVNALSADERNRIRLMINLDMVGVGDSLCISAASVAGEPDAELAFAIGQALEVPVQRLGVSGGSDHVPFGQAGIRSIMLHWEEDPNYHSPSDTADKVDPEKMALAGRIALALISELQP